VRRLTWLAGIVSGLLVLGGMIITIFLHDPFSELTRAVNAPQRPIDVDEATGKRVVAFCSACHAMPSVDSFSREAWHHEVMQGYHFYAKSGRTDLDIEEPFQADPDHIQQTQRVSDNIQNRKQS